MVLKHIRGSKYVGMFAQCDKHTIVCLHHLPLLGNDLNLWVKGGVHSLNDVMKSVKDAHDAHHRQRSQGYPPHRYGRDDINCVMTLLGEQITQGESEREGHMNGERGKGNGERGRVKGERGRVNGERGRVNGEGGRVNGEGG